MILKLKSQFRILTAGLLVMSLGGCADYKEARHAKAQGDYETALTHFEELAEFGHVPSQVELARMYLKGQGVEAQPEKAAELLQKAAAENNKKAYFELGRLYEKGKGVPQDTALAIDNYNKAVEYGYHRAAFSLGRMLEKGKITAKNIPEAMHFYHYSARRGYARAAYSLAELMADHNALSEIMESGRGDAGVDQQETQKIMRLALYYSASRDTRLEVEQAISTLEASLTQEQKKQASYIAKTYYNGGK